MSKYIIEVKDLKEGETLIVISSTLAGVKRYKISSWRFTSMRHFLATKLGEKRKLIGREKGITINQIKKEKLKIQITETLGIKLILMIQIISSMNKIPEVNQIIRTIANLRKEEVLFWLSKINSRGNRGKKAFRILYS